MTRVVLDTNVLVAGLLSASGPPAWILEAVVVGDFQLVFDAAIRAWRWRPLPTAS